EELHPEDVCAVVELAREQPVAAAVARQESDAPALQLADDKGVRRLAERRIDPPLLDDLQALHGVQTAAADHTDTDVAHQNSSSKRDWQVLGGTAGSRQRVADPSHPGPLSHPLP